jgi:polar amino acid transport system permease protein
MDAITGALPVLLRGLWITLQLAAGGIALTVVLALLAGLGRRARLAPLRWIALAYIEVFRGTSALVQLFWFFYVLPLVGVDMKPMATGILVLGLNAGAYGAEVVRGAIQAVPREQWEATIALNLTPTQGLWRVILPQAIPAMIPPFGNIFIELLKNTALVSLISITELTFAAKLVRDHTLDTAVVFSLALLLYFGAALGITAIMRGLERIPARWRVAGGH